MLLERWAPDPRNGVVMTGYNVEGTMARTILQEPESIPSIVSGASGSGVGQSMGKKTKGDDNAVMIPRRCSVEEFSFAAHVTGVENVDFVEEMGAPHVVSSMTRRIRRPHTHHNLRSLSTERRLRWAACGRS
jgi:cleavage and polyadenylation specificity factor subunit 3